MIRRTTSSLKTIATALAVIALLLLFTAALFRWPKPSGPAVSALFFPSASSPSHENQEIDGSQTNIEDARQRLLKKIPISADSIGLELKMSFPDEGTETVLLAAPVSLACGPDARIYVLDRTEHCIQVFDWEGKWIRALGRKGQGPGEMLNPGKVAVDQGRVAVLDRGNMRINIFEAPGHFAKSFKISKSYLDCAISGEHVYMTSMGQPNEKIVDVLNLDGKLEHSFGDPEYNDYLLNWCKVSVAPNGKEVYIAYEHMPLIGRYSAEGGLLNEFRLDHPMSKIQEDINIETTKKKGRGASTAAVIISSIFASDEGLYVLIDYPRTEIFLFDSQGRLQKRYHYENTSVSFCDMTGSRFQNNIAFYLINRKASNIMVLAPKRKN